MNYGPLEFAAYLRRKNAARRESAAGKAARPKKNQLTIITGPQVLPRIARGAQVEAVSVYEAVATRAPGASRTHGPVRVRVRPTIRPIVLVLSSHQAVQWQLLLAPAARLKAVLLTGYGESTVAGAGKAVVSSLGGFYAFKRGSAEYQHLEREVMRCTGRGIENFQSVYAGQEFEVGAI